MIRMRLKVYQSSCLSGKAQQPCLAQGAQVFVYRGFVQSMAKNFRFNQLEAQKPSNELQILFSSCYQFGNSQIVNLYAECRGATCIFMPQWNQTALPIGWQDSSVFAYTVGIVSEGMMEGRSLANRAVNQLCISGTPQCKHVCFDRDEKVSRCVRELGQNGLATDHNDFRSTSNGRRCPNDMLKVRPVHVDGSCA